VPTIIPITNASENPSNTGPAIFLGDDFDDFDDTPAEMKTTCEWLKNAIENRADEVLLENHCSTLRVEQAKTGFRACARSNSRCFL
jgi:hypothetical protein